jgi:hypothetical protein
MDSMNMKYLLDQPIGSMAFRINETNHPPESYIVSDKRLVFLYQGSFVAFISFGTNTNRPFALCRYFKKAPVHLVIVSWAPNGALLGVDGDEVCEPASFGK